MSELNAIYGCFPDVRCLASLMASPMPTLSVGSIVYVFVAISVAVIAVGIMAANCDGGRK